MATDDFTQAIETYERAMTTRDSLEFAEAMNLFEQASEIMSKLRLNPALEVAFAYDMALACDLAGQHERAESLFRKSADIYDRFAESNPEDPSVEGFAGLIWGVKDFLSIRNAASAGDDNYLSSILARRWGEDKMPLKVFIDHGIDTGFDTTLRSIILEGFRAWTEHESGLKWVETANGDQASIVVSRVDGLGSAGGHTGFEERSDQNGNTHLQLANIRIALHSPDSRVYKEPELRALKSLAIHEAGHALGLDGHSPHATDIMYWKSPLLKPSGRDVETLRLVYS